MWWCTATSALAGILTAVDVTPDGRFAATAELSEHTVRVWDLSNGTAVGMFAGPKDRQIRGIQLASNGALLIFGEDQSTLYLPDGTVHQLAGGAWMGDAGTKVAVANEASLRVLSLPDLAEVRAFPLPHLYSYAVLGSADRDLDFAVVATAEYGHAPFARVFDLKAGAEVASIEVYEYETWRLDISEDGKSIAMRGKTEAGKKGAVAIRDVAAKKT